jgi:quercetin dioxygenase-like cupin family protein
MRKPMKTKAAWFAAIWLLPLPLVAQAPAVITMDQEPHHHLALHNDYVKVFKVEVAPKDSIVLHRHDQDTIAIAIGEQLVTVGIPGKPDVHQKNADAQIRLQRGGYVHSTRVDGDTPYHTVAVELLHVQTNFHNVCAEILPSQPLNCPDTSAKAPSAYHSQPLLESDQTRVRLVHVLPGQNMTIRDLEDFQLIVALDPATLSPATANGSDQMLHPGDFVWFVSGGPSRVYWNRGNQEARFLQIVLRPSY